jgi:hypothetical protein
MGFLKDVRVPRGLGAGEKVELLAVLGILAVHNRLLALRCEDEEFLDLIAQRGVEVWTMDSNTEMPKKFRELGQRDLTGLAGSFDVCIIFDSLGQNIDPVGLLETARCALRDDGMLILSFPSIRSWPARLFKQAWVEFQEPYLYYFDRVNIQNILFKAGFDRTVVRPHRRVVTPRFLVDYLQDFPSRRVRLLRMLATALLPGPLKRRPLPFPGSHVVVVARKGQRGGRRKLSVIVPVYNERATFPELMNRLLAKEFPALDREILIIESGSTDGTRSQVEQYKGLAGVKVIYQDRPRGKGNAVREGLRHATGDFILIQDADLEYDLNDYDLLLEPLMKDQAAFILGGRRGDGWRLRKFNDKPWQATLLNVGHIFFTTLINVLYGQRMKDPLTMFKVFRRDCVRDLDFECNGFDFDHELLIKLVRKGYRPIEIPVKYQSRSFREGKKIRLFRDPLRCLWITFKFRMVPIRNKERRRCV